MAVINPIPKKKKEKNPAEDETGKLLIASKQASLKKRTFS